MVLFRRWGTFTVFVRRVDSGKEGKAVAWIGGLVTSANRPAAGGVGAGPVQVHEYAGLLCKAVVLISVPVNTADRTGEDLTAVDSRGVAAG